MLVDFAERNRKKPLNERLKALQDKAGLTQCEIAQALGRRQGTISYLIRNGSSVPRPSNEVIEGVSRLEATHQEAMENWDRTHAAHEETAQ